MTVPRAIGVADAQRRLAELSVVDVRTPAEFATGHLPDALNVPLDRVARSAPELREAARDKPLLLVCASGARSDKAVTELAVHGIPASGLTGGTRAWVAAGHRLEHPAGPVRAVWAMERQVRFTAGGLVLAGLLLGLLVHPALQLLSAAVATGLVFSAVTDTCALAVLLGRLPINRGGAKAPA
ncbi:MULTISPECIES: rhodanese-like domain-containing protein [Streptomyces]|uniref:rhodanese-like domain-containing protein n=1 Tax=Streptomyces TaxID=1883 RepID=UPI000F770C2E|nr:MULTISPECIES: rhodanese-like domain-containing protein [Streptomyces]RST06930.1 rhodanese-like domain-containing protein [Streptomyces sp. WAC07149]GLX17114.1 transporter [Streptomyces lavendulae subsp. lavendulae]GLX29621.1 transporter [Streptomyces lavendulae subsp. lavendulae]